MSANSKLPDTFHVTKRIDFAKAIDVRNLKDKSIIVTGGANGLGAGCVTSFAEAGAYVTILDINNELGSAHAEQLNSKGHHVKFVKTDTSSWPSQMDGFKAAIDFSPRKTIDIVLTSAGLTTKSVVGGWLDKVSSLSKDPEAPPTATIDVNLTGLYYSAHLALYYFKKTAKPGDQGSKQIMFVSSLAGYLALNQVADYVASKYGARGLWRTLRYSPEILGEDMPRFRTNLVCPTYIKTDMTQSIQPILESMGIALGEVADVVAGVMRCACDESIEGRALAIAPGKESAGDRNFDLCDDWEGVEGGRELTEHIADGTIKGLELGDRPPQLKGVNFEAAPK
ncbi:NAD(P)-binding protein [Polyplosphaeria fusca]|uniref:NAD(P)-binding protein n=1 Tax=Polyplosphaeria fusca TaxID=682080 RepID=A0A9P4UWC0_9PLEO|nr:NAD(P)-binding protein [Polyplosphaeria fusca]